MSAGFGFSVGDFIAAVNLLREVAIALKDNGGACDDYEKTIAKLEITKSILSWIESIRDRPGGSASIHAIHSLANLIRDDVESFLARIKPYGDTLRNRKTKHFAAEAVAKIKWSQCVASEVKRIYREIDSKTASLNLLFSLHLSKLAWTGCEELASARKAILHAINDHAASSSIQVQPTAVNALFKQDIEGLAAELKGLTVSHARAANGMLSSMATKDDIRDLKTLLRTQPQSATPSQTSLPMSQDTSRLMLVLTIPQLRLPAKEALSILEHFSTEVAVVLKVFLASFVVCLRDLLLALPQIILLYGVLQRLPQAISVVLRENITFEDALGRMQSLQFQHFRHWTVFEASLRCNFENLPGMQKVLSGQYVLTTPKHRLQLTPKNWAEIISPGYTIKMAIVINTVQTNYQKCPRECGSKVSKVTDVEYRCDICQLVFAVQLEPPEFGSKRQGLEIITRSPLHASLRKGALWGSSPNSSLANFSKPSRDISKINKAQIRTIKVPPQKGRARTQLTAPTTKDPFFPPKLEHKDNEQQGLRRQTEVEELKVLKRVYLTGKDLLEYQFGFSSSQFPNESIARYLATDKAQPRPTQTNNLNTNDVWFQHLHSSNKISRIGSTDMPQLENRLADSTSPTLDPADPESLDFSPSHQSPLVQKVEKRFVCEGKLRSAPGTTWGCGRRYATIDSLSRHFHSEVGQTCIMPLVDEEQSDSNKMNERQIALPERHRDPGSLPASLLDQYPLLLAVEQARLHRHKGSNHVLQDYQMEHGDKTFGDAGSALGNAAASAETQTITASIHDYRVENGRTYHAFRDGSYWGPNDEQAQDHLDLAHHLFTKTLKGKLYLAPIPIDVKKVLDLGTGTGIWATEFAEEFPDCIVIGTDLSPIQPTWNPPKCNFEIDDFNDEWTFGENKFDFIHLRTSHGSVHDRTKLYAQCFRTLKPGGYLEEVEYSPQFTSEDGTILPDTAMAQWNEVADDIAARLPPDELHIFRRMKWYIKAAGFENVHEEGYRWPLGTWPKDPVMKELGAYGRLHINEGAEDLMLRFMTNSGSTVDEVRALCAGVRNQMKTRGVHAIHQMNIVYGQKPLKVIDIT